MVRAKKGAVVASCLSYTQDIFAAWRDKPLNMGGGGNIARSPR